MEQKLPPQSIPSEQSVLGGLMLEQEAWDEVAEILAPDHFYKPAHKKIYEAVAALRKRNQPADLVTVSNHLMSIGELDAVGGPTYLTELMDNTPSTTNIVAYAQIVREKATLRKVISVTRKIQDEAYGQEFEDINTFIDGLESQIFAVAEEKDVSGLTDASELVKTSLERLEMLYAQQVSVTGVSTGFQDFDEMTAGLQPSELVILAARPSMGKTAFSLNLVLNCALREKKAIAYFSVEMAKEQLMMRMLAQEARIDMSQLRIGQLDDRAWPKLINTAAKLSEAPIFIDDTAGISPFEVRAKCRRLKAKHGLGLIVIDYIQLMSLKQKVESREREVSEISKTLKAIAKELEVPVVALAQLNRGVEGRSDRRPMLSDLRESGSIEQDADVILMLFREEYYDRDNPDLKGVAEVIIGKQRNGPVGTVKLNWVPQYGLFKDLDHSAPSNPAPMPEAPPEGYDGGSRGDRGGNRGSGGRPRNFAPGT
ncbi:MAG: replicative DNA helicase [Bdellovibrionales bacterium]|nr:replicative DNA helicase [Bdellovibrionales bacterium]